MDYQTEFCMLVGKNNGIIKCYGWGAYDFVHQQGLRHLTVQIIPVVVDSKQKELNILLYRRSKHRTVGANQLDFCGGHVVFNDEYARSNEWNNIAFLSKASQDAALHEANEELVTGPKGEFGRDQLKIIGEFGEFKAQTVGENGRRNVEYSSVFSISIPKECVVRIREKVRGRYEEQNAERYKFDELIKIFQKTPNDFADGAGRVLEKIVQSSGLKQDFLNLLSGL